MIGLPLRLCDFAGGDLFPAKTQSSKEETKEHPFALFSEKRDNNPEFQ